jgi:hypothetical protein
MLQWLISGLAVVLALLAWGWCRILGLRLARVTKAYWELRYEQDQLRARLARLEPAHQDKAGEASGPAAPATFVPLSALRR